MYTVHFILEQPLTQPKGDHPEKLRTLYAKYADKLFRVCDYEGMY